MNASFHLELISVCFQIQRLLVSLINILTVRNEIDRSHLTVCEVLGLAVRCKGKDQRCCSVSGSEGKSGMTYNKGMMGVLKCSLQY